MDCQMNLELALSIFRNVRNSIHRIGVHSFAIMNNLIWLISKLFHTEKVVTLISLQIYTFITNIFCQTTSSLQKLYRYGMANVSSWQRIIQHTKNDLLHHIYWLSLDMKCNFPCIIEYDHCVITVKTYN